MPRRAITALVAGLLALLVGASNLLSPVGVGAQASKDHATKDFGEAPALLPAPGRLPAALPDQPDEPQTPTFVTFTAHPRPGQSSEAAVPDLPRLACSPCPPARGPPAVAI